MRGIRRFAFGVFGVALAALSGCAVINSSSISGKDKTTKGSTVTAAVDDMGILRLSIPPDLTHKANAALVAQCPKGKLTDVQTELSMREFFVVQLYRISTEAICE
jgi:hypothetical protein